MHKKTIQQRPANGFLDQTLHPVLNQIYAGRQISSNNELDYKLESLLTPGALPGIAKAVQILERALATDQKIVFIGDFDADGATSTALGVLALRKMGAGQVDYLVPNRFDFGYGLTSKIVDVAAQMNPDVLITVDNGIANIEGVDRAKELGASVIITDHHLPGAVLPAADAIVNPNLGNSAFQSSSLAGVGVIFYLIIALRTHLKQRGWFVQRLEPNLSEYLDLVAVGTVADLVPLDKNNRILVYKGLERINGGRCRPGIQALLAYKNGLPGEATASDLGFVVAPRLNAAGRLKDMALGIECLLTEDYDQARRMAHSLDELNLKRRQIEAEMRVQAIDIVDNMQLGGATPKGICLYDQTWHQGLVGLVAGRIKDRVGRPVVAFAKTGEQELKGSARSTEGLHIRDVLQGIDTKYPGLIIRFGGHAAAAGLSLKESDFGRFKAAFVEAVGTAGPSAEQHVVLSDGSLGESELSLEFARLLKRSGPWGQGFPEPVFDNAFDVLDSKILGDRHLKLRVRRQGGRRVLDAIAFFQSEAYQDVDVGHGIRLAYRLDINDYNGLRKPQLLVEHLQADGSEPAKGSSC